MIVSLDSFILSVTQDAELENLHKAFAASRKRFKYVEPIIEYYFQGLAKRINGPALPDIKVEDGLTWDPHGFQVIEEILFSGYNPELKNDLLNELHALRTDIQFTHTNLSQQTISRSHVQQMIQHAYIRIATLGITGFDSPVSLSSLTELLYSLEGIKRIYELHENDPDPEFLSNYHRTYQYAKDHQDFDDFDRLSFLTEYLIPLSEESIITVEISEIVDYNRAFQGTLKDFMTGEGFNPDFYAGYAIGQSNDAKVKLGEKLFYDTSLSGTGSISCATCHKPELAFTDGLNKASNFIHGGELLRNTPTILYSSLQAAQFYDMRSVNLEDQIHDVLKNENEFNTHASFVASRLNNNPDYVRLFNDAFTNPDSISGYHIRNSIASYIRQLNPFNSSFDRYIRGDHHALTEMEILGFNLFAGKAKCATCHFLPIMNGTIPPWMLKSESEILGVPAVAVWENAEIDPDSCRFYIHQIPELAFSFKTPTVRNVGMTGPYMHNGVYKSLEDVIQFYHVGGGAGLGVKLEFQTLPFDSLVLNEKEKSALVSFLQALTDGEYQVHK